MEVWETCCLQYDLDNELFYGKVDYQTCYIVKFHQWNIVFGILNFHEVYHFIVHSMAKKSDIFAS